jgi:hypothetical protein
LSEQNPIQSRIEYDPADHIDEAMALVHAYWLSKAADRFAPTWAEISLFELPAEYIPYVVVCDVLSAGEYRFRY